MMFIVYLLLTFGLASHEGAFAFTLPCSHLARKPDKKKWHFFLDRFFKEKCYRKALNESGEAGEAGEDPRNDLVLIALASTERWIDETLRGVGGGGAYTRKEISYECETATALADVMSGIFRRLREVREAGENHGEKMESVDTEEMQSTLRLTRVLVIPLSKILFDDFKLFDKVVDAINRARRDARDYILDPDANDRASGSPTVKTNSKKWVTAVNLSHMHPNFGEDDSGNEIADENENDALKAYKEQRKSARQSPFPTLVLEVKSSPPQPILASPAKSAAVDRPLSKNVPERGISVSAEDIKRLEAMFGKSASDGVGETVRRDDEGEDAATKSVDRFTKSIFSPIGHAQNWVVKNDPSYDAEKSSFLVSDCRQVDGTYEFVLSVISSSISSNELLSEVKGKREYIILNNFCTKSATSLEKFLINLCALIELIPSLAEALSISNFHPEHLDKQKRSPAPILVLQWKSIGIDWEASNEAEGAFE